MADQLLRFLRNQKRLLVLDNFEHLLAGADFVAELLAQASGVKLLVTSCAVLNLWEEWLFPLTGLAYPPALTQVDAEELAGYSAVQLFGERVRRVRPAFTLRDEGPAIAQLCQLVEGLPLALELAATWAKSLTSAELASEIERGIGFLSTSLRNSPDRHRSMAVVFERNLMYVAATTACPPHATRDYAGTGGHPPSALSLPGVASLVASDAAFQMMDTDQDCQSSAAGYCPRCFHA